MADPIMDLFDDPNLFGLDPLPPEELVAPPPAPPPSSEALPPPSSDPLAEALGLSGALDPAPAPSPAPSPAQPLPQPEAEVLSQGNPFMGVSAPPPPAPPPAAGAPPHKIVILKAPPPPGGGPAPATPNGGKVTLAKVLAPPTIRAGGVASAAAGGVASAAGGGARQVKQLLLQPLKAAGAGPGAPGTAPLKPGLSLTPAQGESKRITLVLQQTPGAGAAPGQRHVVLGTLPGKLLLQGGAAATPGAAAKGRPRAPAKVVTIQLQVQPPAAAGHGAAQKIQLIQPGAGPVGVAQVPQVVGGAGQRLTVPLKVVLQPQASSSSSAAAAGLSVVKVLSGSEVTALAAAPSASPRGGGGRRAGVDESRKLEHQKKQEKANRIVAEAIARAQRLAGEQNIPRVLNEDELPSVRPEDEGERKRRRKDRAAAKEERPRRGKGQGKSKGRGKASTITPVVSKKRKRNASSDNSDSEALPAPSPRQDADGGGGGGGGVQKRRSNRQVKRKKYTEDLDIKLTDDEELDEELDVTGPAALGRRRPDAPCRPAPPRSGPGRALLPSMQFFVENPSEEDAAIVDKVLAMRVVKKELPSGQLAEAEEFFVKYKNYSYLHCEWATIAQLEKDKRIHQKLKRFKTKMNQMRHFFHEDEEPFNPDYVEVDRILDESHSVDKDNGEPVVYYLVKWCSLPYEDSTWELQEDVDEAKVAEFKRIQARHPELKRQPRPQAGAWKKLEASHEYKNHNQLREYQLEGVNWLLFNWYNRQNCILADEMGLGKTIQSIAFLQEVHGAGVRGPYLVIAPLSTIANWEREFGTWTHLNTIVYHGSLASRQMIQQYEMYCKDSKGRLIPGAYKFDALITTFEMILSDCPELREVQWRCVVIDEAHRLKNRHCKLLDSLKHMDLEHKVLLTGTPLQNTVEELFSLLHFLEPSQFPSEAEFLKDFGDLKTEEQVQKLQALLKPMMLRRLKEDVEKNLAPKQETIIEVELTNAQKRLYRAILERNFAYLARGAGHGNVPNLLNTMMELRKCCNHPYLINGAEEQIVAELRASLPALPAPELALQALVRSAGKLVLLDKLLPRLRAGGHKVLVFWQMVRCLDILEDYLIQKRYPYERIDGRVRGNLRQAAIDRFSRPDSDRFVFLLCTRAGGLGINLTAADTCIIFDSDWNPQNDLQAQARCHRIGQSKAVKVYRLITRNSYEREMFDKASLKLGLDKAVLQSMSGREGSIAGIQQFSKKEIEGLRFSSLRPSTRRVMDKRRSRWALVALEKIEMSFGGFRWTLVVLKKIQASFVASENRTDIALDDPNFWQKWAKKADLDLELLNSKNTLVIDTPRVRKQTDHFSTWTRHFSTLRDDDLVEFSDLESDEDLERPDRATPARTRRGGHRPARPPFGRSDCVRVEKHLMVYGWGRWRELAAQGRFKRRVSERDVESLGRAIVLFCLRHFRGDDGTRRSRALWVTDGTRPFACALLSPGHNNGRARSVAGQQGSPSLPRGRKGRKAPKVPEGSAGAEWLLQDEGYRKHLRHHGGKLLLRVRTLHFLRHEVIGEQAERVLAGASASDVHIWLPALEQPEPPAAWWDPEADKSLLLGVLKHGYERYHTMRADPALCFLARAGGPDAAAVAAEQRLEGPEGADLDKEPEDAEYKPLPGAEEGDAAAPLDPESLALDGDEGSAPSCSSSSSWPSAAALTARFRRLIGAVQRGRTPRAAPALPHAARAAAAARPRTGRDKQQRWTRREQADFLRVASTFGVELEPGSGRFRWGRFRALAGLERRSDEELTRFYHGFVAMCRQVCRLPPAPGDVPPALSPPPSRAVSPLWRPRWPSPPSRRCSSGSVPATVSRVPVSGAALPAPAVAAALPALKALPHSGAGLAAGAAAAGSPAARLVPALACTLRAGGRRRSTACGGAAARGIAPGLMGPEALGADDEDEEDEEEEGGGEDEDSPPPPGEGGSPKAPLPHPAPGGPQNLLYWPKPHKEFTVQIKDEEGLKLTFQKHRLGPNGAQRAPNPPKKNSKKLVELELRCLEGLRDPPGDPEGALGAPPPHRGDGPEFADPRLHPFVEQRREKWHRKKFIPSPPSGLDLSKMVALMGGGASSAGGVASPSLAPPPRFRPEAEEEAEAGSGCCPLLADPMLPPTSDSD
ncbi:LOW QUALITY PROTEIN: chromodomain-helicase-DNA-binding protein 8-like [Camarhynchus parvulus]|uniref:LOW QUALITY PROTEIN: chromodomain-helicase-DNA-binding protein 8-like n=1 Tax=Geospiza parvula TaxID=87175 RepID=UPI001237B05E|nr:LOW QUALITY PROTEIN: chromodomain-helicase-DNA-binding protein 8-like [Camarhynchus parvulus]